MTTKKLMNDLQNYLDFLTSAGLALHRNKLICVTQHQVDKITWAPRNRKFSPYAEDFATLTDYIESLSRGSYSALLFDGSILQITFFCERQVLVAHRLCYLPCPFDLDPDLVAEEPLLDVIDLFCAEGLSAVRLRTPIRFDYNRLGSSPYHPLSHLHLVKGDCRIAVISPLSIGHFSDFVFRHFYSDIWRKNEDLRKWPRHRLIRTISAEQEEMLHIAFRDLPAVDS